MSQWWSDDSAESLQDFGVYTVSSARGGVSQASDDLNDLDVVYVPEGQEASIFVLKE